mgnify:CR=1 FL=1
MGECIITTTKPTTLTTIKNTIKIVSTTEISFFTSMLPFEQYSGKWNFGEWTMCSTECGEGVRRRLVACRNEENGEFLDSFKCDLKEKPIDTMKCIGNSCSKWIISRWSNVIIFF